MCVIINQTMPCWWDAGIALIVALIILFFIHLYYDRKHAKEDKKKS